MVTRENLDSVLVGFFLRNCRLLSALGSLLPHWVQICFAVHLLLKVEGIEFESSQYVVSRLGRRLVLLGSQ